jgi:hypothetical protein
VQLSVKYETVLNMTTAKALGLDVPTSNLLSADERNTATQEDWIADGGNGSWSCKNSRGLRYRRFIDRRSRPYSVLTMP